MVDGQQIIDKVKDFPTLPTVYTKLMEAISNPRSTVQDVADVIIKDQSSTVKILKVVNSPVFGIKTKVNNISQAIFYLGFNEIKNIVLTLSVMDIFSKSAAGDGFNIIDLWKHSIAVGVITKILGNHLGVRNTEDYFVSGVIHDIGILLMVSVLKDDYKMVYSRAQDLRMSLAEAEKKVFGVNHYYIGELIAEKWQLPRPIRDVIRYQHKGTIGDNVDNLVATVHLGNIIASLMNLNYQNDPIIAQPNFKIWNSLQFKIGSLPTLNSLIISAYNESASILKLKD